MIELWLIRHGQTFDNITKTLAGHTPGKLTALGEKQAIATGEFLKDAEFDFAYVSDLARTVSTFQNIQSQMHKQIPKEKTTFTPLMREKGGGEYEGKPLDLFRNTAANKKIPLRQFKGKGGESWDDVNARARKLLLTLALNHLCSPAVVANSQAIQNGGSQGTVEEEEEAKTAESGQQQLQQEGVPALTKIIGVSHGGFIMEIHNVIDYLQFNKEADINNVAKNCSIHKIRIQLKADGLPADLNAITLANLRVDVLEKNNDSHCKHIV